MSCNERPRHRGDARASRLARWISGALGNVVILELINWYRRYEGGDTAVLPWGLVLSLIVLVLLLFTGWRGWKMVYRHCVGVADPMHRSPRLIQMHWNARFA